MRWFPLVLAIGCTGSTEPDPPLQERALEGPFVGRSVGVVDPDGDGVGDLALSAPGLELDGGVYRFAGLGERTLDDAEGAIVAGRATDVGPGFASCGDIDGDGAPDWLVGAPDRDDKGGTWLIPGPVEGTVTLGEQPFAAGLVRDGRAGFTVACGDVDDDGLDEIALSAPDTDGNGIARQTGTIALHAGAELETFGSMSSTWSDSHLGFRDALVVGHDLNGDGIGDMVVGGHGADRVHVVFGPLGGTYDANDAGPMFTGIDDEGTGHAVDVGDLDGDGALDIVIGAPFAGLDRGAVWVLPGPFDADSGGEIETRAWRIDGIDDGAQAGFSLAVVGDLDGDGSDDLWVGAPGSSGVGLAAGAAFLLYGPADDLNDLDEAPGRVLGDVALGRLGWDVAAGDLDGDGVVELIAGAPEADIGDRVGAGAAYAWSAPDVEGLVYPDAAVIRITP